jgi:hypothetical protein
MALRGRVRRSLRPRRATRPRSRRRDRTSARAAFPSRVVVKQNGGGFTGYVDVVGLADGRSNAVLVFFNRDKSAEVS